MRAMVYILGNAVGKYTKNNGMLLDGLCGVTQVPPPPSMNFFLYFNLLLYKTKKIYFFAFVPMLTCIFFYLFPGKYGTHAGPLFILHILYISVSVWACSRILTQPSMRDVELTVRTRPLRLSERNHFNAFSPTHH